MTAALIFAIDNSLTENKIKHLSSFCRFMFILDYQSIAIDNNYHIYFITFHKKLQAFFAKNLKKRQIK
jgi:hypothetical protein